MIIIPLEVLFVIWLAAIIAGSAASLTSFKAGNRPMGWALMGFALGGFSMLSFYAMLLYVPIVDDYRLAIAWSRWAIGINGLTILFGSMSAFNANRTRKHVDDN